MRHRNLPLLLIQSAFGTAVLAVSAWISLPIPPIPFTMQTLALFTLAGLLGMRGAFFATAGYLALGCFGMPVFAGGAGGPGVVFGPTGGFLVGFLLAAPLVGWLARGRRLLPLFAAVLAGTAVVDLTGAVWFWLYHARIGQAVSLYSVLLSSCLPFLLPDLLKAALAAVLIQRLRRIDR